MSALPAIQHSWQSIHAEVLRRIRERDWKPGDRVPDEAELATEFGCARATVNRAMREAAQAGFLERKRKGGTRVATLPVRKATLDIPVIRLEVESRDQRWSQKLLLREMARPEGVPGFANFVGKALHLRVVHKADGRAFLLEERWINPAMVPQILEIDLETVSANEWLVSNAPFSGGDIAFSAANASDTEAGLLAIASGAALFVIERVTCNGDQPITQVRLAYAPGYRMQTSI